MVRIRYRCKSSYANDAGRPRTGLRRSPRGLEDNIYLSKGVIATNLQLVQRAVELAKIAGREIATADDAREILGITRYCLRDGKTGEVTFKQP